jgi:hypothetical protein
LLDVEAVAQQSVEDGMANGPVLVGLGGHLQRPGAEILATATTGAVFAIGNLQPGDALIGQGTDAAVEDAFAGGAAATEGTGPAAWRAPDTTDDFMVKHGRCSPADDSSFYRQRTDHALTFKFAITYARNPRRRGGDE